MNKSRRGISECSQKERKKEVTELETKFKKKISEECMKEYTNFEKLSKLIQNLVLKG
jgi:hypothetical protein